MTIRVRIEGPITDGSSACTQNLVECKGKSKEHYDKTAEPAKLQVGDNVLLFDETVRHCREKAPVKQTYVSYVVGQDDQENTVNINGRSSGDNLNLTDAVSPPAKRASHPPLPRVEKSYF